MCRISCVTIALVTCFTWFYSNACFSVTYWVSISPIPRWLISPVSALCVFSCVTCWAFHVTGTYFTCYYTSHPTPPPKQNKTTTRKKRGWGGGREGSGEYIEITPSVCLFVCHPVHVSRQYLLNCWTIFNESCLFSVCSRVTWRFPYSCQCHVLFFWCSHCPDGLFYMVWLRCLFECGMLGYWGNWFPDGPLHQLLTTLMCVSE